MKDIFYPLLAKYTETEKVEPHDVVLGDGAGLNSITATEFIMDLEAQLGVSIGIDDLDETVETAGDLYEMVAKQI